RHALPDAALRTAILDERFVGPAQHVDKARSDRHVAGIHFGFAARIFQFADGGDLLAVDADVSFERMFASAIVNRAVADKHVVVCACREQRYENGKDKGMDPMHAVISAKPDAEASWK